MSGSPLQILAKAELSEAKFTHADLSGADLSDASLYGTALSSVALPLANLRRANLSGAIFQFTELAKTDLTEAQVGNCVFANSGFDQVQGLETVFHYAPLQSVSIRFWSLRASYRRYFCVAAGCQIT